VKIEMDLLDWRTLTTALALLGFLPGFVLRQVVRIYPKGDPRRAELVAELHAIKNWLERPLFVAQQFETALAEGVPARLRTRGYRRTATDAMSSSRKRSQVAFMADILKELANSRVPEEALDTWCYIDRELRRHERALARVASTSPRRFIRARPHGVVTYRELLHLRQQLDELIMMTSPANSTDR
jgi:hypothetical protein